MSLIRTRWAAIGAATAITLGAGGIGLVDATTSSGERTVLTTLDEPCRIASLRPAPFTVGPRPAPLAADETLTISARGTAGDCTLPIDAVALALNVTALNATQNTNLRFWATGATQPTTANLNPSANAAPIGNAVTTGLSNDGEFNVYNFQGNVQVVIDVLGYYTDHNHDDRYYTKGQADGRYYTQDQTDTALAEKLDTAAITPDLLPTAHGYLNGSNPTDLRYVTGVQSVTENAGSKRYEITMDNYYSFHHLAQVTLRGGYSSCPEGTQVRTSSVSGKLLIYVLNDNDTFNGNCSLDYVVYAG